MFRQTLYGVLLSLSLVPAVACAQTDEPILQGYVTRAGTPQNFDANNLHIICTPKTVTYPDDAKHVGYTRCDQRKYGQRVEIRGKLNKKTNTIESTQIDFWEAPLGQSFTGLALIDKLLSPGILRADGYAIQSTSATKINYEAPLSSTNTPSIGQWIEYVGKRGPDGVIVATQLVFHPATVKPDEQKLNSKNDYDPSAVSDQDRQDPIAKFFLGTDVKRIPAVHDSVQQQRVEGIGKRLIPDFQNILPETDPGKLHFRFQIVDSKMKFAYTLSNGIILVPAPLTARLDDQQLAAILAFSIATALEKQAYRYSPTEKRLSIVNAATLATTFIPFVNLATQLTGMSIGAKAATLQRGMEQQGARMSLVLLHDAGFNIETAPIAWWRIDTKKDDYALAAIPWVTGYLFETIAVEWNPPSPLVASPSASAAEIQARAN